MTTRLIDISRDGPAVYVTLNRPEVRNAFNEQMIAELTTWCEGAADDPTVRCAVIRGAGPMFCAGADVAWMSKMVDYSHDESLGDAAAAARMYAALDKLPFPLLARVHGAAFGGGAGLAAVFDVVLAENTAVFAFSEVKFG